MWSKVYGRRRLARSAYFYDRPYQYGNRAQRMMVSMWREAIRANNPGTVGYWPSRFANCSAVHENNPRVPLYKRQGRCV